MHRDAGYGVLFGLEMCSARCFALDHDTTVPWFTGLIQHSQYPLLIKSLTSCPPLRNMDTSNNDNSPASARLAVTLQAMLGEATDQFQTLMSIMKAYNGPLGAVVDATANNPTSGMSSFLATLGVLFKAWAACV
jgi:hypothetical protein